MDIKEMYSQHKVAFIVVGGVVAGAVIYSFLHKGSSSSTTTATTFNPSSGSTVSPSQYLVPYNAYFGSGGTPDGGSTSSTTTPSTGTPSINVPLNNPNTPSNPEPPVTVPSAPATSGPKQYGYGQENIGGMNYSLLGIETNTGGKGFYGYNVSGGAPVYFLAPGSTSPTQGPKQIVAGAKVLVPSIYDANISATPVAHP